MAVWRTRPLFISSTFKDLHAERDYLRDFVFPELQENLRQRQSYLEPIDLRLGIAGGEQDSEEGRELAVLKLCLDEIRRSRPFLIVLLGDRYGWVPSRERMQAAAREAGFNADVGGQSVTALEIQFGIFNEEPEQRRSCFFYFREPLPYAEMGARAAVYSEDFTGDPEAPARVAALRALKREIEADPELGPRVRTYRAVWDATTQRVTGLEELGRQVLADLSTELQAEVGEQVARTPHTWEDQERQTLAEFVEERSRGFIGRDETVKRILDLAHSPQAARDWGICITGDSGSGKSALFAHVHRHLQADASLVLLSHAAGISARAGQVDSMLRRWVGELAVVLQITTPLAEDALGENLEKTFLAYLGRASVDRRVVVLIDALNQFDPVTRARFITWLPRLWPPNARLIATAIAGSESATLDERAGTVLEAMPPLTLANAREVAATVCRRYHRTLHTEIVDTVLSQRLPDQTPAAGNPLWLTLAIEELNLLDEDDFELAEQRYAALPIARRLHQLLFNTARALPADVATLYTALLQRTEKVFGEPWARAFASLIALSRYGWRESDLRDLVPKVTKLLYPHREVGQWSAVQFAALRRGLRAHLIQRGAAGQWDFFHAQMRRAVAQYNLGDPELAQGIHILIADHLEGLAADDPLRQTELMVHLVGAGDQRRAAALYGNPALSPEELTGATAALARHMVSSAPEELSPRLEWITSLLDQPPLDSLEIFALAERFNLDLSEAIANDAGLPTRLHIARATEQALTYVTAVDPTNTGFGQSNLCNCRTQIGALLHEQGDLVGALAILRESLSMAERLAAKDPNNTASQHSLARCHLEIGKALSAQSDTGGALAAYRAAEAAFERLVAVDPSDTGWQCDLFVTRTRIGNALRDQGDMSGALAAYRVTKTFFERLIVLEPTVTNHYQNLFASLEDIGGALIEQGDIPNALAAVRDALTICERLVALDPTNRHRQADTSLTYRTISEALLLQGEIDDAWAAAHNSLAISARLAALDPLNADWLHALCCSHSIIGDALKAKGDTANALTAYRNSLVIAEQLTTIEPTNTNWQHDFCVSHSKIGEVMLFARHEAAGALVAYRNALDIAQRMVAVRPSDVRWQRDLSVSHARIGQAHLMQGDVRAAFAAHRSALASGEDISLQDPKNATYLYDLSIDFRKCGDALLKGGDIDSALAAHHDSLTIRQRLVAYDPTNTVWQRDLSINYIRIGEILLLQDDAEGAIETYRAAVGIRERLAAKDPRNSDWQRDLAVSQALLASACENGKDGPAAKEYFRSSRLVLRELQDAGCDLDPEATELLRLLEWRDARRPFLAYEGLPPGAAGVSRPHPSSDPARATRLNFEYQRHLAAWQALPLWKRWFTKKPEPPAGI